MADKLIHLEEYEKEFLLGRQEELSASCLWRSRFRGAVESLLEIVGLTNEEA